MILKLNTVDCAFNKQSKVLVHSTMIDRFPERVEVTSHHTGRVVIFAPDTLAAAKHEYWDGEEFWYKPIDSTVSVKRLILTRG